MWLDPGLKWLEATALATEIRENEILFPWVESVHVLAIALVVGSISILDLRLLGLALGQSLGRSSRQVLSAPRAELAGAQPEFRCHLG